MFKILEDPSLFTMKTMRSQDTDTNYNMLQDGFHASLIFMIFAGVALNGILTVKSVITFFTSFN